jgi:hypothetical protein
MFIITVFLVLFFMEGSFGIFEKLELPDFGVLL